MVLPLFYFESIPVLFWGPSQFYSEVHPSFIPGAAWARPGFILSPSRFYSGAHPTFIPVSVPVLFRGPHGLAPVLF